MFIYEDAMLPMSLDITGYKDIKKTINFYPDILIKGPIAKALAES